MSLSPTVPHGSKLCRYNTIDAHTPSKQVPSPGVTSTLPLPALHQDHPEPMTPTETSPLLRIASTRRPPPSSSTVDTILDIYQSKYGAGAPIVASNTGEELSQYPSRFELYRDGVRQRSSAYFRVMSFELELDEVMLYLAHPDSSGFLSVSDWKSLSLLCTDFYNLVSTCIRLRRTNFWRLRQPRFDYEAIHEISLDRMDLMSACLLHYKGDIGLLVRFIGGEYTASHRIPSEHITRLESVVEAEDLFHIRRILTDYVPSHVDLELPRAKKFAMLHRGNQASLTHNQPAVLKTMIKEEKYSHLVALPSFFCRFSAFANHVSQGMNLKKPESPRIVWDGSTKLRSDDIVMNAVTSMEGEAKVTFGDTKRRTMTAIYNQRISFPDSEILLAAADIKACFRWPRLHPDLSGAFGFVINFLGMYFVPTANVFGSVASASSWEPFRRAIEAMSAHLFASDTVDPSAFDEYFDLITWDHTPPHTTVFVPALRDSINTGMNLPDGSLRPIQTHIYVDDCLCSAPAHLMRRHLASVIAAIFEVMGEPDLSLRQCSLALDKWTGMNVGHEATFLGMVLNTRDMTIAVSTDYRSKLLELIDSTWHPKRHSFSVLEIEVLIGKVSRLGEAAPWIYHLLGHLYASASFALSENRKYAFARFPSFRELLATIRDIKSSSTEQRAFASKKAARIAHRSKKTYFINPTLREEISIIREALSFESAVIWSSPIGHMIDRIPTAEAFSDACLFGGGGYSIDLTFWWHLTWPLNVQMETLRYIEKKKATLSINVLEFVAVIINFAGALTSFDCNGYGPDPHPVLLAWADNRSAVKWFKHACSKSLRGRALGRFLCMLLINSPLGVNSKWLSTMDNSIADAISRLQPPPDDDDLPAHKLFIDFSLLQQSYPGLANCRIFQPNNKFLSYLWSAVLHGSCPTLETMLSLRQHGLGRLGSSNS